jgi:zinc finger BED domain-containing protein 5/7/8/9
MDKFLKRTSDDNVVAGPSKKPKIMRKYNPDFVKYGFVNGGSVAEPKAQCLECGLMLSNEALKPSKLKRHLDAKHPSLVGKSVEFFERKQDELHMQKRCVLSLNSSSKSALKASYLVARRVAQSNKSFTIAEELLLPAAVDMCREMVGEVAAKKLLSIPLSNDTISRRILDMAEDIQQQFFCRIKSSPFYALQLDESTDVSSAQMLLVFVRYQWESKLHDDILFCRELPTRATAHECFRCMDEYFSENELEWQKCVGVCSDGAASMTGRHNGVIKQILDRAPEAEWTHCFLHRESLAAKKMSPELNEVMNVCVKTINVIKKSAVNSRCFARLCEGVDAEHVQLLYHSEVRWLSRGLVLNRLYELRNEVSYFLSEEECPLAQHFTDTNFIAKLAYLCDIFSLLNQLNIVLQGRNSNIFFVADKVQAFKKTLSLWSKRTQEKRMDMFPLLSDILETSPEILICDLVSHHLSQLSEKFEEYFPKDLREGNMWMVDPFSVDPSKNDVALPSDLESQLLDVSTDSTLKIQWDKLDLATFWIHVSKEYPFLSLRAIKQLLRFTTTYLCESAFSTVATTKTKSRNRLRTTLEATLRLSLSPIPPQLDQMMSRKQAQASH